MSILNRLRLATPPLGEEGWKSYATENFRRIAAYLNRSFLQSDNYDGTDVTTGDATLGWRIESSGKAEFLDVLVRGELNAEDISAGTLSVDRIAARSMRFDKLMLNSADNLLHDPGFENNGLDLMVAAGANTAGWSITSSPVRTGTKALQWATGGSANADIYLNGGINGDLIPASEGDEFYFEIYCRAGGSGSGARDIELSLRTYDENHSFLDFGATVTTPTAFTFDKVSTQTTCPAGTAYVVPMIRVRYDAAKTLTSYIFDDGYIRQKVSTPVIEDRAVDIQRLLEPVKVLGDGSYETDIDLSTSNKVLASGSVTIPSWAGTASGIGMGTLTIGNPEGSSYYVYCQVNLGGDSGGEMFDELAPSPGDDNWENITAHNQTVIAAAGSTFSGDITGRHSGTTTWNVTTSLAQFNMLVTFTR